MGEIKSPRTIHRESKILYELWKDAPVGTARGWFVLGAAWALVWARWGVCGSASKFAGENEWECDKICLTTKKEQQNADRRQL